MKVLILCMLAFTLQLAAMDKILGRMGGSPRKDEKKEKEEKAPSPRSERHKKDEKEKPKMPRDDKQKLALDNLKDEKQKPLSRDITLTRFADRRVPDTPASRETKSASPAKGSPSPARPSTVGKKRGSLDWTEAIKSTFVTDPAVKQTHAHMDASVKNWREGERGEEELNKMYEEARLATPRTKRIILCQIMNTPSGVSQTKVKVATDIYEPNYRTASTALYNLPGYILSDKGGQMLKGEAQLFHKAYSAALAAYVDSILAAAPKREKYMCEMTAKKSPQSPLAKLWIEYKELKKKHPAIKHLLEPEIYPLAEPKTEPKKP